MKHLMKGLMAASALALVMPAFVQAHFTLIEPASSAGRSSVAIRRSLARAVARRPRRHAHGRDRAAVQGDSKLHIKVMETIYHPGFYRIALVVNAPTVAGRPRGCHEGRRERAVVGIRRDQSPPRFRCSPTASSCTTVEPADGPFETDVQLPNINCEKCTVQIVQFMAEHGFNKDGGYNYHHCADLQITADRRRPIDARWPSGR